MKIPCPHCNGSGKLSVIMRNALRPHSYSIREVTDPVELAKLCGRCGNTEKDHPHLFGRGMLDQHQFVRDG